MCVFYLFVIMLYAENTHIFSQNEICMGVYIHQILFRCINNKVTSTTESRVTGVGRGLTELYFYLRETYFEEKELIEEWCEITSKEKKINTHLIIIKYKA